MGDSADKDTNLSPDGLESLGGLADETTDDAELWSDFESAESDAANNTEELPADGASDDFDDDAAEDDDDELDDRRSAAQQDSQSAASGSADKADRNVGDGESDVFANATPEQRAAFQAASEKLRKLEQSDRSQRGRVSALSRELDEYRRAKPPAKQQGANNDDATQDDDPNGEYLSSGEWSSFKEEYPEVAGPLGNLVGRLQAEIANQGKQLSAIGDDRISAAYDEQRSILTESHPDWESVAQNPEFHSWLNEQPRFMVEAAQRNSDNIVDAEETGVLLSAYKAHAGISGSQNGGSEQSESNRKQGSGRRERQRQDGRSSRSRGPAMAAGIPEDGDEAAIWKAMDKEDARRRRA